MKNITNRKSCCISLLALMLIATPINQLNSLGTVLTQSARLPGRQNTVQLRRLQQREIPLATTIKGTIATPIIWTDNSRPSQTRATITLNEPLLYDHGDIALPKDSSLVVEVSDWDDAGFVTLSAIAIVYENSQGKLIQRDIPENTFLIRNEDNEPLAFTTEESNGGNSIVGGIIGEAVQTGTRSISLPESLGSVVSRTIRKNSRRARRASRDEVYSIEEETSVSIYVNSFLSIEE